MRAIRWRSVMHVVVAAAVLLSVVAGLGPSAASGQSGVELAHRDAELSPTDTAAGDEITVRSVGGGCGAGSGQHAELVWAVFPRGEFEWGEHLGWAPSDAVASSGSWPIDAGDHFRGWSVTFPAPDLGENPPAGGDIGPGSPVTNSVLQVYGPLPFTVDGHQLDFVAKCYTHPQGHGEITISPEIPELGGTATVTTDDTCPMPHTQGGAVTLELWSVPDTDDGLPTHIDITDLASAPVAGDGSWSIAVQIPADPDRRYAIATRCRNVEGGQTFGYLLHPFDVREPSGPPIETPPGFWDDAPVPPGVGMPSSTGVSSAAPAQPVLSQPTYTG
jgi:hypothetical protein